MIQDKYFFGDKEIYVYYFISAQGYILRKLFKHYVLFTVHKISSTSKKDEITAYCILYF